MCAAAHSCALSGAMLFLLTARSLANSGTMAACPPHLALSSRVPYNLENKYKVNPVILKRAVLLVKKPEKFGLNGFYIVNSVNRGKITMSGFDPIFGITGYHLMLRYNGVRYNGVDFVHTYF